MCRVSNKVLNGVPESTVLNTAEKDRVMNGQQAQIFCQQCNTRAVTMPAVLTFHKVVLCGQQALCRLSVAHMYDLVTQKPRPERRVGRDTTSCHTEVLRS